jgi:hypothetical protein
MKIRLLHDREFPCLTEDIVKETPTNYSSFPFRIFSQQVIKRPQNSLSSCYCSLFVTVSVCRQPDANISHTNILTQIQDPHGPLYRLRLRFLSFIKKDWIPNFQKL